MIEWIVGGILLLGAVGKKSAAEAEYKSRHSDD